MSDSLVIFTKAAAMLAEADTIQKAKELKDLAITAGEWVKRKGMGEKAIIHCRSYALEAERKMGEMLMETERAKGTDKAGRPKKIDGNRAVPSNSPPTLKALGLSKNESSKAQALAAMPRDTFEKIKAGNKTRSEARREQKRSSVQDQVKAIPKGKFRVLLADPPWHYGDQLTENYGGTKWHYPSMTIAELCALPVSEHVAKDAVLFLWVTSPLLSECWPVIEAWGFTYKTSFVWDKVRHNMGHYNSVRHEFLLICTRGKCTPDSTKLIDSVQTIERSAKHSEKPEEFRKIIETMYVHGRRLELFAREPHAGWEVFGNEC